MAQGHDSQYPGVSVTGTAEEALGDCQPFRAEQLIPCSIVIFGASGDLTARKLIPALFTLFINNALPSPVNIIGCARTELDNQGFRNKLEQFLSQETDVDMSRWPEFSAHIYYQQVQYDSLASYEQLSTVITELDSNNNTLNNRIFYLAVPPPLYPVIGSFLGEVGLSLEKSENKGWARIVVEKPFGQDLQSAIELDKTLHRGFQEHQIFRIDHYLAKETVQNVLMLRFANTIFEPLWNRGFIDYVGIVTAEKLGVEHRAGYYEQAGVLRDMFQNHMMQLLALTAMEPPSHFEAARVRDEKVKVFRSLKPFDLETIADNLILGQYTEGIMDGKKVAGYNQEPGVAPDSMTPTFAMLRVFVDNWRWRDVPFYLVSGKRMARKETKVVVQFKKVPHSMFRNVLDENILANRLILGIYPDEEIKLTFQTKSPGGRDCLRPVTMDFKYYEGYEGTSLEAYQKVLLDCILGDQMLFWRQDGVELSWSYLTPILNKCETCLDRPHTLYPYAPGTLGPKEAEQWLQLIMG